MFVLKFETLFEKKFIKNNFNYVAQIRFIFKMTLKL